MIEYRKILELEEEVKVVGNNMRSLEIAEQEVSNIVTQILTSWCNLHLIAYAVLPSAKLK